MPGIEIENGKLLVDQRICVAGDLLHEAGHLAVIPTLFRSRANTDLDALAKKMGQYLSADNSYGGDPVCRAILQSGECEATAWAWAAGTHLGFPPNVIIHANAYQDLHGNEGASAIRQALSCNSYFGINGLQAAGWCAVRAGPYAEYLNLPVFPRLAFWTQKRPDSRVAMAYVAGTLVPSDAPRKMRRLRYAIRLMRRFR